MSTTKTWEDERRSVARAASRDDEECLHDGEECDDPEMCRCVCVDCCASYESANTEEEVESGA